MTYEEVVAEINEKYKDHMKKKKEKYPPEVNSNELLDKELTYGPHGQHVEEANDNITGHHMPSQKFMGDKCDVDFDDAFSLNLEQKFPGVGGRHRRTFTYGVKSSSRKYQLYSRLTPRDALALDLNDVRRILKEDGLYNKETRKILQDYIKDYKNSSNSKGAFDKNNKLNEESNRVKQCKHK